MEKSEPTFVPEWLRNNGSVKNGTKTQPKAQSFANSDGRIRSIPNNTSQTGRSPVLDRTTSTYFRRSSSSNSYSHLRSSDSYDRGNQDREWDRDKLNSRDRDNGYSHLRSGYVYPSGNRFAKDTRHSFSSLNAKHGETWKGSPNRINSYNSSTNRASFQRDYPSLGAEGRRGTSQIKRVSSPDLATSITHLPSDRWTSALTKAPALVANDGILGSRPQASHNGHGVNEADSLKASPCRSSSSSTQLPTESQKVEEQSVKQSRYLVPMTSSMPKESVHSASEKLKPKVGQQMQISSSLQSNNSSRVGPAKFPSPIATSRPAPPLASAKHKVTPVLERRPSAQIKSRNEFFNLMRKKSVETPQSTLSPSDLDNDVEASLSEGGGLADNSDGVPLSDSLGLVDKVKEIEIEGESASVIDLDNDVVGSLSSGGGLVDDRDKASLSDSLGLVDKVKKIEIEGESACVIEKSINERGKECSRFKAFSYSEEKEVAFLNWLGWERTEGEEEGGLTEDEISAFCKTLDEQIKSKPYSKSLQRMQLKFSGLLDNRTGVVINGCVSS